MNKAPFKKAAETGIPVIGSTEERLVVVTPDTPGFDHLYDLLYKGELVYPNDPYFERRFGKSNFSFEDEGTNNKLVLALMTPERVRLAISVYLSQIPENNCTVNVADLPCDAYAIRTERPRALEKPRWANVISGYSITNFRFAAAGLQPPDDPVLAKEAPERFQATVGGLVAGRYLEATVSPIPQESLWLEEDPARRDLPFYQRKVLHSFASAAAARARDAQRFDYGFNHHVISNGAFIGKYSETNTSYVYRTRRDARNHRQSFNDGYLTLAHYIRDELPTELQAQTREHLGLVKIFRKPVYIAHAHERAIHASHRSTDNTLDVSLT